MAERLAASEEVLSCMELSTRRKYDCHIFFYYSVLQLLLSFINGPVFVSQNNTFNFILNSYANRVLKFNVLFRSYNGLK